MALTLTNDEYAEFRHLWEEMKKTLQEGEAERKSFGDERQETKTTFEKLNTRLDHYENQMSTLEQRANRPPLAGGSETKATEAMTAFKKALKYGYKTLSQEEKGYVPVAPAFEQQAINGYSQKAVTVVEDTTGGFFAPPEFDNTIIKGLVLFSPMRQYCRVRPTSARSVQMGKRTGYVTAAWTAEKGTRTEITGFSLGRIEIPTQEMYSMVLISEQDLEDPVIDIEAELRSEMTEQFGVAENKSFVDGDGATQPQGLLTNGDVVSVKSGTQGVITADTLIDMVYALPDAYAQNSYFMMRRTTLGALRKIKTAVTTSGSTPYLWQPGLENGQPPTILGHPYIEVPDMPAVANDVVPIVFGNLQRGYVIVDRVQMAFKRLAERWAEEAQIGIMARRRVGGQVVLPDAFRKYLLSA